MKLIIEKTFKTKLLKQAADPFCFLMNIQGEVYRKVKNRVTLKFYLEGGWFFIKKHYGVGWREIFKNLICFRLPIVGAKNEYAAVNAFEKSGISTYEAVAFGQRGLNLANQQSFVVTKALDDTSSLEELCAEWKNKRPSFAFKKKLIQQAATIAKKLHQNGMNHRDFYICHFLIKKSAIESRDDFSLYLIDLHRVQIRKKAPLRWIIKDLAGLYFSTFDVGLTRRDIYRFLSIYFSDSWPEILKTKASTLKKIAFKAGAIKRRDEKKMLEDSDGA
jgi:heptose I phosphotransferase